MIGDLGSCGFPHPFMSADVFQRLIQVLDAECQADDKRMQRNSHDSGLRGAFGIQSVKLIADHLQPIFGRMAALKDDPNIVEPLLVRNADHAPRLHADWHRLIVTTPIANIIEPFGCKMVQLTSHKSRDRAHAFYERLGWTRSHEGFKLTL